MPILFRFLSFHQEILDGQMDIASGKLPEYEQNREMSEAVEKWISRNWQR